MKKYFLIFYVFFYLLMLNSLCAEELSQQISINILDRLARIEEGQKAIISEMKARFEASDKRFEAIIREMNQRFESLNREMIQRFEAVDQRFEAVDQRFVAIDQRFEALNKRFEAIDKRFEAIDKRFEAIDKRFEDINQRFEDINQRLGILFNFVIAIIGMMVTIFLAIIGYAIWDKKTDIAKKQEPYFSPLNTDQNKMNQIIDIMKKMSEQMPEMKKMMHAANLL